MRKILKNILKNQQRQFSQILTQKFNWTLVDFSVTKMQIKL